MMEKKGSDLGVVWGNGNNILVFTSKFNCKKTQKIDGPNIMQEVEWENTFFNKIARKSANDSSGIFLGLQKLMTLEDRSSQKFQQLKISHKYRSVLKATVDNLQTAADEATDATLKDFYEEQSQSFYKMELAWNLVEILFLDVKPAGTILNQLLDWIRWHFCDVDRYAKEALDHEPSPDLHPRFWDTVTTFVLQGRIEDARKMLHLHSDSGSEPFRHIDELLRKMPIFLSQTVSEFELHFQQWQDDCKVKFHQMGLFGSSQPLQIICRILCGDKQVFNEVAKLCETWYHLLISKLLYTQPTVRPLEIQRSIDECFQVYGCCPQSGQLDIVLLAAFEYNPFSVIKESSMCFDTWWFPAHLTDLLYHCDKLNSDQVGYSSSLREFLLLDYVASLMSHPSLWQIGVIYLEYCPTYGKQHMEQYLEKVPLYNDSTALKVLHVAQTHELPHLVHSVCHVMGMKALQNRSIGSALTWALKSKDSAFATYLAEKLLKEYSENGKFSNLDLLENLGSSMIVSDKLTFLAKYQEFHRHYEQKEFQNAATLLTSLLASRLAPRYFWLTLLLDALPLLESEAVTFTSEQTYELMYCLEVLQNEQEKKAKIDAVGEKVELVRLALARNLARSIISEGTVLQV